MDLFNIRIFRKRRHSGAIYLYNSIRGLSIFCLLFSAIILLSSCAGGSQTQEKRAVSEYLSSMEVAAASGQGTLYEITQLALGGDDSILCCAGLYDETHVLLLYGDKAQDGSVSGYTAKLLDLTGSGMEDLATFPREERPGSRSDGSGKLSFLSADPLIIHDRQSGILYRLGSGSNVILPDHMADAEVYWQDGRLLLSSDRGILCEAAEDGSIKPLWTLPCEYGAFTPVVSGHEGRLTFATYARRDPSLQVYVDVAPGTGESEYYLSDINPSRFSVTSGGLLLGPTFRTAPAVSVCDPSEHVKKELELPDDVLALLSGDDLAAPSGEETGTFLSFSTFPLSLCGDWCSFALNDDSERPAHLYLWNTASCRSAKWDGPTVSEYTAPETIDYGKLSARAKALEDKYGVRIILGENIPTEFADYDAEPFTGEATLDGSLSVLENVLSLYPESYFDALKGNYYRDIAFYLTGPLRALNTDSNISNASAFATDSNGTMQLAFDMYDDLSPDTVIHELTPAADYRFAGEGLFDEEAWNAMNPAGFSYYYSDIDENGESYETSGDLANTAMSGCAPGDVWFIDPYSKTFPMEDRARLMENLLSGRTPYADCYAGKHVQEKLSFYFRFLRETLGDDTWPAQTAWEEALAEAASGTP